jgi:hypothetical protein
MNTHELMGYMRGRYAPPAWALLEEVRDGTGFNTAGRLMDAMAFGLWPSRGLEIHGFEVKSYRGDWLRELKQPDKAESFYRFVDRWWIVAGDKDIVKVEELPKTWGLLIPNGKALKTVVEAPLKKASPVSRLFMMAIIRRVCEAYVPKASFDARVEEKVAEKIEAARENAAFGLKHTQEELAVLYERLKVFEEKSGVKIDRWTNAETIGSAVKIVLDHGPEAILDQYGYLARRMKELGETITKATDEARSALERLKVTA